MRKSIKKILSLVLISMLILTSIMVLSSCDNSKKIAKKIEIEGLKDIYALDEQIKYSDIKVYAHFRTGIETFQLTPEMVKGFNSATTKENAIMTITYASASIDWLYSVVHDKVVDTPLRVNAARTSQEGNTSTIKITASGLPEGKEMNSIMMTISCTTSATIDSIVPKITGFDFALYSLADRKFRVLLCSGDGFKSIQNGDTLFEVQTTVSQKDGTLYITNIESADGEKDYRLPDVREVFIGIITE
ncbi:MAG TPA: hypothetical protein PKX91_04505 [Clostridia bacterium]|jgi:hypothetical protein|nr:hypothetical protein [Clostridia bacterium]